MSPKTNCLFLSHYEEIARTQSATDQAKIVLDLPQPV